MNEHWECFSGFDAVNESIITGADDGDVADIINAGDFSFDGLFQFYIELIIDVLNKLKVEKVFTAPVFEKDMLLGLQFGDADDDEHGWIIRVSEKVNSLEWHNKMRAAYKA